MTIYEENYKPQLPVILNLLSQDELYGEFITRILQSEIKIERNNPLIKQTKIPNAGYYTTIRLPKGGVFAKGHTKKDSLEKAMKIWLHTINNPLEQK